MLTVEARMMLRKAVCVLSCGAAFLSALYAFQRPFRVYPSLEAYDDIPIPPDYREKTEWVFARLMFPSSRIAIFSYPGPQWREGGTSWTEDYPRADRHFAQALRRLTRIQVRSVEQPVNLEDGDDVFNYPWLYAGLAGDWDLSDLQVNKLRDFLLRGGFLFADDFWGESEWAGFESGMKRIFPGRPIVDLGDAEPIFHTVYDLDDRYQIPGEWGTRRGMSYRNGGIVAHWMGIFDDKGRVMVAINYNSDTGDSWEWADVPHYPEKFSALGIRIGVNYVTYAMTH